MAKEREIERWIIVRGSHIPLYEGQTVKDAMQENIAKRSDGEASKQTETQKQIEKDADKKEAEIAKNKAEADARNKESNQPPRRLYLPDISAETANKTSDVLKLGTRQRYKFKEDTNITKVHVFAGKGCSKEFRDAEKYAKRYKDDGEAKDWQHCSGIAQITDGKVTLEREVHWVQGKSG